MKKFFLFLTLLTLSVGQMWGAEELYKTATFTSSNCTNNSSYTSNITCTVGTDSWSLVNAANNNGGWNYVKMGAKKAKAADATKVTTCSVNTSAAYSDAITKVVVYGTLDRGSVSAKLIYASNSAYTSNKVESDAITTFDKDGKMIFEVASPTASRYYKVELVCSNTTTTNGVVSLTKVEYYHQAAAPSYTITAQSSNNTYGTVSLDGSVITATPAANCRIASTAYNVTSGSATVTRGTGDNINKFTVSPSSNCTVRINFEQIPTHKISFNTGGLVDIADATGIQEGVVYNISQTPAASLTEHCEYGTFVGWTTASSIANPSVKPTIITSYEMGNSDVTLYAVYKKIEGDLSEVTVNFGFSNWGKTAQFSGSDFDNLSQEVDGVTVTDARNTGSLYANNTSTRFYKANELTFASDENISSIVFTVSSYQTDITANVGTCTATSTEFSWEGTAKSVTFTRPSNASSYAQFSSAKVIVGDGVTSYSLDANCCTQLDQINGSFFWPTPFSYLTCLIAAQYISNRKALIKQVQSRILHVLYILCIYPVILDKAFFCFLCF